MLYCLALYKYNCQLFSPILYIVRVLSAGIFTLIYFFKTILKWHRLKFVENNICLTLWHTTYLLKTFYKYLELRSFHLITIIVPGYACIFFFLRGGWGGGGGGFGPLPYTALISTTLFYRNDLVINCIEQFVHVQVF